MGIGLLLVYFVYGVAFWVMGLAVLLESGRATTHAEGRSLRWLASFGVSHGTHEWLQAYLLLAGELGLIVPAWIDWLRGSLLVASFGLLLGYASFSLRRAHPHLRRRAWLSAATVFCVLGSFCVLGTARTRGAVLWTVTADVASRYLLAVPSALLAALAMWATTRHEDSRLPSGVAANSLLAAGGFAAYAASQLFVHPLPWFPANTFNEDIFLALVGVPIQALRAISAFVISIGMLRAMQAAEQDRQRLFSDAHHARLEALAQQDSLRRDLLRHIVRSQEDERSRIARELHDQVAQLLTAFSLELASLRSKLQQIETIEMVARLQQLARQMSESLYHIVRDLRPAQLDNLGLVPALRAMLGPEHGLRGLDVTVRVSGDSKQLDGAANLALFRVAQEALSNVLRHAQVRHADLELLYEANQITLRVCDPGRGFDPTADFVPPRGWGLAGMRERVEALGGRFSVRSSPAHGTTIEAAIPLPAQPAEDPERV